jgi:hypothetical protein
VLVREALELAGHEMIDQAMIEEILRQTADQLADGYLRLNLARALDAVMRDAMLPGDFNNDGSVDAADYVVWRFEGRPLEDYDLWAANFGRIRGNDSSRCWPSRPRCSRS